jgi:N-acetyl-gamma-glutamyl-phosphate reductase
MLREFSETTTVELAADASMEPGARWKARVAVIGATGYAGAELIALLARHPAARIARLMSSGRDGKASLAVEDAHPALRGVCAAPITPLRAEDLGPADVDFAFLATPHEVSHAVAPLLVERGIRVVDLSGAFRLKDSALYAAWYGFTHSQPEALDEAVYGLPELNADAIRGARLVANPGCYATSVILALAPLIRAGVADSDAGVVCDSKSGASGAGRSLRDDLLFPSVSENCRAYGVFKHRHVPEILQALNLPGSGLTFTPHLLPVARGILSTIYLRLRLPLRTEDLARVFHEFYADAPFVRVYRDGQLPEIQSVAHSPYADIGWVHDAPSRRLVIVSALDNLGKGAASQAVQNMNLMLGCGEDAGLR